MRLLAVFAACWLALAGAAAAEENAAVTPCSRTEPDATRTLCHEIIVPAARAEVWRLWSTSEGLASWAAPLAAIDLRIGGLWEASYQPDARLGDPGNIQNRVLSYAPGAMLSIQIAAAPPGFPHVDLARRTWTVIDLESINAAHTRVRVSTFGYGEGAGFDQLYAMFDTGNAWSLRKLHERVTGGPADWRAIAAPADPSAAR
jgi:uncharacterized protein YndB with AHSA1/START domain